MNKLLNWLDARFPLRSTWRKYASNYYVPKNLNSLYLFGSLAVIVLIIQLITGLWLTMFYTPTSKEAFSSLEFIMREVNWGWLLRYVHSTGASAMFIILYMHLFRGLLYGSYQKPRELVWLLGMGLFFLLLAQAFFGHLLPWGQMSYWSVQVITSLLSAIPYIGDSLVTWLRGDYSVSTVTLQRFFALHVIGIPLLLLLFIFLHIVSLHKVGSNNPQGVEINSLLNEHGKPMDGIPFHPYFTMKELVGLVIFLILFFMVVFFFPEMGGYFLEPANFLPANPLATPDHIVPMWYMSPFYSILRAIPSKLGGVMAMIAAIIILLFMPWLDRSPVRSMRYKGRYSNYAIRIFVINFFILGYLGTIELTHFKQELALLCTLVYFAYFLLMPIYSYYESYQVAPERLS